MITISFSKNRTLTENICFEIKNQITNGILKPNEKLPSKRSLSEHLGVSVITVQNAYSELISEGYIYSIEKKGFFVTDLSMTFIENTNSDEKNRDFEENNFVSIKIEENQKYFANFFSNSTNSDKFPFSLWAHLMRKVLTNEETKEKLLSRVSVKGVFELRNAISKYLYEFRNMKVNPEQIVIGAGTESLCSMIVQILGRDFAFAVENPGYHKIAKVFESNGAEVIPIQIDESGINPDELEKTSAKIVHISPSHHFPTGIVMPIRRRKEILLWAEKNNGFVIEDEYDSEFRFNGKPLSSLQSADENGRVIYMNTFSKTLAPSFRLSYMILPKTLLNIFDEKLGFYSCSVSAFEQFTLAEFIKKGYYGKHIIRMKNHYRNVRNNLINAINSSSIKKYATIQESDSGLHFLIELNSDLTIEKIHQNLLNEKINIPLLSDFFYKTDENSISTKKKNAFVLNYSEIEKEKIPEIVKKMEKCFI